MLGRDVLSRLLYGVRNSILVGLGSSLIALSIGVSLGIISGYFGGMINIAVMRLVNIMLAIPPVMLAVALVAVIGPHAISVILAMGLTMWSEYASVVRSRVLVMKEESFVLATRTLGAGDLRIILRHILPNIAYLIIVIFTLQVGQIILWASGLSFIGIGGADVSWGWDIAAGRVYIGKAWWLTTFPGMAIFVTVLGFNLFGDWLRDAVDPTFQMKA
jgi:peptide/nickel transport system permease protein